MAALTPPPPAPQRGVRATFAARFDAFITWVITFVSELGVLVANLNSIAAGGAYAVPFIYSSKMSDVGKNGYLCWPTANTMYIDTVDAAGAETAALIASIVSGSNSSNKGQLRFVSQADPRRAYTLNILGYSQGADYGTATVQLVSGSPFGIGDGEGIIVYLQRTGDKGDKGDNGTSLIPTLYVREEYAQGTNGPSLVSGGYLVRTLNATKLNGIPGVTVSGNRVTVANPGTYNFLARAPGFGCSQHRLGIWSVTNGNLLELGSSEYSAGSASSSSQTETRSCVEVRNYVIASSTTYELRHYAGTGGGSTGGVATNLAYNEVYAEFIIEKVA